MFPTHAEDGLKAELHTANLLGNMAFVVQALACLLDKSTRPLGGILNPNVQSGGAGLVNVDSQSSAVRVPRSFGLRERRRERNTRSENMKLQVSKRGPSVVPPLDYSGTKLILVLIIVTILVSPILVLIFVTILVQTRVRAGSAR